MASAGLSAGAGSFAERDDAAIVSLTLPDASCAGVAVNTNPPAAQFTACGLITLTTDFGTHDPFVGVMKGRMLGRYPQARIVDLTHEIRAHWPAEAGFWLARCYRYFPAGTVHVAVVDPGVGSSRQFAVVEADGHLFLAPDNGLLATVVARADQCVLRHVGSSVLERVGASRPSATFHGRDVFAPLAAEIAAARLTADELGPVVSELIPGWLDDPVAGPGGISGVVVTVDHFGNLLTNIDRELLAQVPNPVVRAGGHELPLRRTYSDARPGDYLALVNSFGVVEIARAERSAAEGLGLDRGAPVSVIHK
jgi:S-adenosylmethionine hydrolase